MGLHKSSGCDQHHSLGSTLLTLLFPSSSGFSRISPQLYKRHLSPQPQHDKKPRKANPPFAHLGETPALLLSLCGCCQPFHTSHLYSFLLGACSLPRHHSDASVVRAATTKTFSLTTNTVLAATLLHSPEDHPPHWSHNFLCLHVHSKTKN